MRFDQGVRMHRVIVLVVVVSAALIGVPSAASSAPPSARLDAQVSGDLSGTSRFEFSACAAGGIHRVYDGTYDTVEITGDGPGRYHLDVCFDISSLPFTATGMFTITTPGGAQLRGTVAAGLCASSLDFNLTVTSATRQYRPVRGSITMCGTSTVDLTTFTSVESGVLRSSLVHPSTRRGRRA